MGYSHRHHDAARWVEGDRSDARNAHHVPPEDRPRWRLWGSRLGWFAGLWTASVLTLAAVAFLIRTWIGP